jgi:23S rRNA U2552 (ribose-2'-O)-methylase RlmE/FtsJ
LYNRAYSDNIQRINYPENVEFTETNFTANDIGDLDEKHSFQIYPNPAENILNVISANSGRVNFSIYDIYGKKQISGMGSNTVNINISDLNPGIYVLSISDNYQIFNFKFLKK